jgi:hypothetical protein
MRGGDDSNIISKNEDKLKFVSFGEVCDLENLMMEDEY